MTYTIDRGARLIRLVGSGRLTDEELLRCVSSLREDPALDPGMNTLSDMRDIEVGFTSRGISSMLAVMEETADRRGPAKAALVVSSDVAFGMGRMLQTLSEGRVEPHFRIFRDMSDACEWLGIDPLGPTRGSRGSESPG